ncbi:MAG: hypothetical protein PUF37_00945 [Prevotellaceae bacterium]|nr:hypothetical protein [Prevotellaceae bacterium]
MGTFGIFAIIVTFILLVYYAVTIAGDLTKLNKKKEAEGADIIPAAEIPEAEEPVAVVEHQDGQFGIKEPGKDEEVVDPAETISPEQKKKVEEDIKAAEEECEPQDFHYQGEQTKEEFDAFLEDLASTFEPQSAIK